MLHLARAEGGLPQKVGAGFTLSTAIAAGVALAVPGYVRPGAWHTLLTVLTGVLAISPLLLLWGPRMGRRPTAALVLASNAVIVLSQVGISRDVVPVGFVLFTLPTTFTALFLPRRVFALLQTPAVVAGIGLMFWICGEHGATLALHWCIALAGVMSPGVALLILRKQLEAALESARDLAGTDPLTGLANRRGLAIRAGVVAAHAHREGVTVCLVTLDLDNFKQVNDGHGHRVGDVVLQRVAATLRAHTRAIDVVARVGGEEFVVFAAMSPDAGLTLAERIRERIATDFTDVGMTASLGVSAGPPPDQQDDVEPALWGMVDRADDFMYVAKRLGRNRVVSAPEPSSTHTR